AAAPFAGDGVGRREETALLLPMEAECRDAGRGPSASRAPPPTRLTRLLTPCLRVSAEMLLLFGRQVDRHHDIRHHDQVPSTTAPQTAHALPGETSDPAGLGSSGHL